MIFQQSTLFVVKVFAICSKTVTLNLLFLDRTGSISGSFSFIGYQRDTGVKKERWLSLVLSLQKRISALENNRLPSIQDNVTRSLSLKATSIEIEIEKNC